MEEQLVSKKIAERLPVSLAAKSATLAALERVEKARKELDEASRELLTALNLQGSSTDLLLNRIRDRTEARTEKKKRSSDRLNILLFFYRKQFIQLKPIRAMTSELTDRIWGRLGLSAVRAPQVLPAGRSSILKDGICVALEKPASNKLCPGELAGASLLRPLPPCQTSSPRDLYGPAKLCKVSTDACHQEPDWNKGLKLFADFKVPFWRV